MLHVKIDHKALLQAKIDHINQVVEELEDLKVSKIITGITKLYGDGITLCLTSDLSEAIANNYVKYGGKLFREVTVNELIDILKMDIEEKKLALEKESKK